MEEIPSFRNGAPPGKQDWNETSLIPIEVHDNNGPWLIVYGMFPQASSRGRNPPDTPDV